MALTTTKCVDFVTLRSRGLSAAIIVKLMMACNDLSLTDQALADWKNEQRRDRISKQSGACMYFVRAQISHLYEGLIVIQKLRQDSELSKLVRTCDPHTQRCFHELKQYVCAGPRRDWFEKLAGRIRSNLAFHYDESGKLVMKAIADRASEPKANVSLVTQGDTIHQWHFKVADDVVDSIVVRQIWDIPRDADLRVQADAIAEEIHKIVLLFLDFSGEVIWKYL
jgi:hypothetical protein